MPAAELAQDRPTALPRYRKPPAELSPVDEDRIVRLDPARPCTFCGDATVTAKVVHIEGCQYEYACLACASPKPR